MTTAGEKAAVELVLGLSVEVWTALGAIASLAMLTLMVLQILLSPRGQTSSDPEAHRARRQQNESSVSHLAELALLIDVIGLTTSEIAKATSAAPSTVRGWLSGRHRPTGERAKRLHELASLASLGLTVMHPTETAEWLRRSAHLQNG